MAETTNPAEGWDYPATLPAEYCGFSLLSENRWDGPLFHIFSYGNETQRRSANVVFDRSTLEYMLRLKIGLTEFCDLQFIHGDLAVFEGMLRGALLPRLETLQRCLPERMESLFRAKMIHEWPFQAKLPGCIDGFELCVQPETCVQVTNGSYLILDYTDFSRTSSLRFYYNVFRDDFYAEYLVAGAPRATSRFDAASLDELAEQLRSGLQPALAELEGFIAEALARRSGSFSDKDIDRQAGND